MLISSRHVKLGQKTLARVEHSSLSHAQVSEPVDRVTRSLPKLANRPSALPKPATTWATRLVNWLTTLRKPKYQTNLNAIKKAESWAQELKTPADFQAKTAEFQQRLAKGESLDSLQTEAYAVARQAAKVATDMRPYDCQVAGGLVMADGGIAEMMTGEGKTLTAVLPLYLNALAGKGAHLVTVNDRLAQRDRDDMAPIFETLGLTVGCVTEQMSPEQKRQGYNCDVTYTTDRNLGFDYLRDRTVRQASERVQRPPFFALVDEVDQVLLDEARTPLIISGPGQAPSTDYLTFQEIVEELRPGMDYYVDRENGATWLTETGVDFVHNELHKETLNKGNAEDMVGYHKRRTAIRAEGKAWKALQDHRKAKPNLLTRLTNPIWNQEEEKLQRKLARAESKSEALSTDYNLFTEANMHRTKALFASLRANTLLEEGVDYLVSDHRVKIVDENKGRTSKGRRYNEGLHQALEAKSGVPLRPESQTLASITYPNLFAKYERLSGMSGTALSSAGEFEELYDLPVTQIPTNLQFQLNPESPTTARRHNRLDMPDVMFATKKEKFEAVVAEAIKAYEEGVPVLVGTLSVEANEYVYAKLLGKGVPSGAVQLLNADRTRGDKSEEDDILAQAGRSGLITVATNMVGRGVNVRPDQVNFKKLAIAVEQQLTKGAGSVTIDVQSPEEAQGLAQWLEGNYTYRVGEGQAQPGEALIRVKSEAPNQGPSLNSRDFPTGGLYVIGTERAKSRRIDDQLIGRAGRHGQTGKSRFFLSKEDDLFQHFGGSHTGSALKVLAGPEAHQSTAVVDRLVSQVQARVNSADFHAREDTTAYDKVLNAQREAYYGIRDSYLDLDGELRDKLTEDSKTVVLAELAQILPAKKPSASDVRGALRQINERFGLRLTWEESGKNKKSTWQAQLSKQIEMQVAEAIRSFDQAGAALDEPYRQTLLTLCDQIWSHHLEDMQTLKTGISWVSFAEKDPETEFAHRGFELFESSLETMRVASVEQTLPQLMLSARLLSENDLGSSTPRERIQL